LRECPAEDGDNLGRAAASKVPRELIYVPIAHSAADMGSLAGELQRAWEQRADAAWERHQAEVAEYWRRVRDELLGHLQRKLGAPCASLERVRIYQDGLPVGGAKARQIVEEVAARGSDNYLLVKTLLERGAHIEAAEQAHLLKEEYELVRRGLAAHFSVEAGHLQEQYRERAAALLNQRDEFIARAIARTLGPDEIGVLFIGALHHILPRLPCDISVTFIPTPPAEQA